MTKESDLRIQSADDDFPLPGNVPVFEVEDKNRSVERPTAGRVPKSVLKSPQPEFAKRPQSGKEQRDKGNNLDDIYSSDKKKKLDPFQAIMKDLEKEHKSQLDDLKLINENLKQRLDAVLTSTWGLTEESWMGRNGSAPGDLKLSIKPPEDDAGDAVHEVTVEDQQRIATSNAKVSFKPRPTWSDVGREAKVQEALHGGVLWQQMQSSKGGMTQDELDGIVEDEEDRVQGPRSCMILHPHRGARLVWDVFSAGMLFWDVLMVPLGAFDPEDNAFFLFMDYSILAFWTLDIIATFNTGFLHNHHLNMERRAIAIHYITGQFFIDLWIVGLDWFFTVCKMTGFSALPMEGDNAARLARAFRCVRIYRLMRLRKLRMLWIQVKDQIESDLVFLIPMLLQLVIGLAIMNHIIGSLWYLIGAIGRFAGSRNWIDAANIADESLGHRYLVSLRWALHNFCLATSTVVPQNEVEGTFAACTTFFGLAVFYLYASTVTCSFIEFRALRGETTKEFWLLRRYLRQRNVNSKLKFRIINYAEVQAKKQLEMLPDHKVALLSHLSEQLGSELVFNINYSHMFEHPLLNRLEGNSHTLQALTLHALSKKSCAAGDAVSTQGMPARYMHLVNDGLLKYSKKRSGENPAVLHTDDWICEASLWVPWVYQGSTSAISECELIDIEAVELCKVIAEEKDLWALFLMYAKLFIETLNKTPHTDLSDIHIGQQGKDKALKYIHLVFGTDMEQSFGAKASEKRKSMKEKKRLSLMGKGKAEDVPAIRDAGDAEPSRPESPQAPIQRPQTAPAKLAE